MTITEQGTVILPAGLGLGAAATLMETLQSHRGRNLRLVGSESGAMGAQCLQVILSARVTWNREGCRLWIAEASPELESSLVLLGVEPGSTLMQPEAFL